jgi:membrane-associated phospholipid phosphatase
VTSGAPPEAVGRPPWWLVLAGAAGAAAIAGEVLAGGWLRRMDGRVAAGIAGWHLRDGAAYPLLWLATAPGSRGVLLAVLLAVAGWAGWRHRTLRPLGQTVLALALLAAVVGAVKLGAGRPAPVAAGWAPSRDGTSFPSGHVANAVVGWGVVRWQSVAYRLPAAVRRPAAVLAVVGPVSAGLAVLALDFHWLSDVVAGAAVGVSLLGVVHALDGVALSLWVRARAGRRTA